MNNFERIKESSDYIKKKLCSKATVGLICGTGLGPIADQIQNPKILSYSEIPHFPMGAVAGHANRVLYGTLGGASVIAFQGRFHYYEGHDLATTTLPVRIMAELGVKNLIVTNAAGGLNRSFRVGDIMAIEDHINFQFQNPLIGKNFEELGPRFPDMSSPYSKDSINLASEIALEQKTRLHQGVYLAVTGPSYETRAELRWFATMADAVGMSTVPEVTVAKHAGITHVLGLSVITNMATGEDSHEESHEAVVKAANEATPRVVRLVQEFISRWNSISRD